MKMSEFDYKQRKTTDAYRKGWEKVYSSKYKGMMSKKDFEQIYPGNAELAEVIYHTEKRKMEETTKQKQPLVSNPSTE